VVPEFNWSEIYEIIKPLLIFIVSMSLYSIFIFNFYRFLAKKDIIELNLRQYSVSEYPVLRGFFSFFLYILEYIVLVPIFIFFWFSILGICLTFLSKNTELTTILLIAMAVVGAVRVVSYYNEDLSKDLAKMLPFSLLGVLLIDISSFNVIESYAVLLTTLTLWHTLVYYLVFIVTLEFNLRIFYALFRFFFPAKALDWQ